MSVKTGKPGCSLTDTQLEQLLAYVEWTEFDGTYYGRKDQFDRRHAAIMAWIRGEIAEREGRQRKKVEEVVEARNPGQEIPN